MDVGLQAFELVTMNKNSFTTETVTTHQTGTTSIPATHCLDEVTSSKLKSNQINLAEALLSRASNHNGDKKVLGWLSEPRLNESSKLQSNSQNFYRRPCLKSNQSGTNLGSPSCMIKLNEDEQFVSNPMIRLGNFQTPVCLRQTNANTWSSKELNDLRRASVPVNLSDTASTKNNIKLNVNLLVTDKDSSKLSAITTSTTSISPNKSHFLTSKDELDQYCQLLPDSLVVLLQTELGGRLMTWPNFSTESDQSKLVSFAKISKPTNVQHSSSSGSSDLPSVHSVSTSNSEQKIKTTTDVGCQVDWTCHSKRTGRSLSLCSVWPLQDEYVCLNCFNKIVFIFLVIIVFVFKFINHWNFVV